MSPGRIQDPEGSKHLVMFYQTIAGAVTAIIENRFPLVTYKDALTCRLKVDGKMTARDLRKLAEGSKKVLIHAVNTHPLSILSPTTCTAKSSPRGRAVG